MRRRSVGGERQKGEAEEGHVPRPRRPAGMEDVRDAEIEEARHMSVSCDLAELEHDVVPAIVAPDPAVVAAASIVRRRADRRAGRNPWSTSSSAGWGCSARHRTAAR